MAAFKKNNVCCIFNIGAHYRFPIYSMIASRFNVDFYLGDHLSYPVKKFEYNQLNGFVRELSNIYVASKFYWQKTSIQLVFKHYQYYILDGEPYCLSSWLILILAKIKKKKTIAWTHGWYGRETWIKRKIKKIFYSLFEDLMIYGEYAISMMQQEGFSKAKLFCIANSLDYDRQIAIRNNLTYTAIFSSHFSNSNPVLFYIGRVQLSKKLNLVIECISILKKQGINLNFVVAGQDIDGVNLEQEALKYNVPDNVWLFGPCYNEEKIGEMFYNSDICISPGNVGLTAIHALTYGCPVITHNNFSHQGPEFEAIIPGETGDFFEEDNTISLVREISNWIKTKSNQKEIIRQRAYATIEQKWNYHHQIDVLNQVMNKK